MVIGKFLFSALNVNKLHEKILIYTIDSQYPSFLARSIFKIYDFIKKNLVLNWPYVECI